MGGRPFRRLAELAGVALSIGSFAHRGSKADAPGTSVDAHGLERRAPNAPMALGNGLNEFLQLRLFPLSVVRAEK